MYFSLETHVVAVRSLAPDESPFYYKSEFFLVFKCILSFIPINIYYKRKRFLVCYKTTL